MKILRIFNKTSIRTKFIIVLILSVFLMFIFNYFASDTIFKLYEDKIYKQSEDTATIFSSAIENELLNIDNFVKTVFFSEIIQEILLERKNNDNKIDRYNQIEKLKEFMWGINGKQNYIKSMFFIDEFQSTYVVAGDASININIIKDKVDDILKNKNEKDKWFSVSEYPGVVFKAYDIVDNKRSEYMSLGTIVSCVNMRNLGSSFENIVRVKSSTSFYIISEADILYGNINSTKFQDNLAKQIIKTKDIKNNIILTDNLGNKYISACYNSGDTGWQYINLMPYSDAFKDIITTKTSIYIIYLLILFVVALVGWRFSNYILKPVRKLSKKMSEISLTGEIKDSYLGKIEEDVGKNEISILNNHFNEALATIKKLTEENMTKQELIQETRYNALQLQIRPHFLYNTLETIKCLGIIGRIKELNSVLDDLGSLLRTSLKNGDIVTIEEELSMLHNYINIQKIRYEERLDYSEKLDKKLYDIKVPKMILQPLVENAINYGLDSMLEQCIISLYSEELDDHYQIIIEDNGPGMDKDFLTKLKRHEIKPKGFGIGLANIDGRLKMVFGEDYGLFINSIEGHGTCVSIRIPKTIIE